MKETILVDILGACTIRDVFEMNRNIQDKYKVNIFIQNNPPTTLGYDKLSSTVDLSFCQDDFKNTSNCWFKWFTLNAEEEVFSFLKTNKTKWLIVNLCETFYSFYEIRNNNKITRICSQTGITKNNISSKFPDRYKTINPLDLELDSILNDVDRYCGNIKSLYQEDNIILIENYPAKIFVDRSGIVHDFYDDKQYNDIIIFLNKIYYRFLSNVIKCNVIKLPENAVGDISHKWGLNSQHYIQEAYDYLGESINLIIRYNKTQCNAIQNKQKILYNDIKKKFDVYSTYKKIFNPYSKFCEMYATLRIDVKSVNQNKDTLFIKNLVPTPLSITKPEWLQKWRNGGDGFVITSCSGEIKFNILSTEDCELIILIKGVDARDITNTRYDIFIDCKQFIINNSIIFNEITTVCHDKPYTYIKNMVKNEEIFVSVKWCPTKYFNT